MKNNKQIGQKKEIKTVLEDGKTSHEHGLI